jgi:hypothetical protein
MSKHKLAKGRGAGNRRQFPSASSAPPSAAHTSSGYKSHAEGTKMPVQSKHFVDPHFPFQPRNCCIRTKSTKSQKANWSSTPSAIPATSAARKWISSPP